VVQFTLGTGGGATVGVVVVGGVAVVVGGAVDVEHDPETHRRLDASKHANGGQVNL
jgi:hypothetical protein